MKVYLVGCGMGNPETLTVAAKRAVESSALLIGAQRLLDAFDYVQADRAALIYSDQIVEALAQAAQAGTAQAAVLLSGDVGFYSGATALRGKIAQALPDAQVESLPGISSLVYFAAKLGTPWQDAFLVSAHGRDHNAVGEIQRHPKTFLLTGGKTKVADVCRDLVEAGLDQVRVAVGQRLSYADELLVQATAAELADRDFADLAVMMVWNDAPLAYDCAAPTLTDDDFLRGKAPMTKAEVRALAVCKLRISPDHVVWDVGAGTGSVSIECARAANAGRVFAVEKNPDALELLEQNKQALGAVNLTVVPGTAPEALADLPAPDRVFVGGSTGQMEGIFACALQRNPQVRLVASAITLETVGEVLRCLRLFGLEDADICQVQVAKGRAVGGSHLMMGQNPVYLIAAQGASVDPAPAQPAPAAAQPQPAPVQPQPQPAPVQPQPQPAPGETDPGETEAAR